MLLHDSTFHLWNRSGNHTGSSEPITIAYSSLFHSTLTLLISSFGVCFNFLCAMKIWSIISQYRERKQRRLENPQRQKSAESPHILAGNRYRYLLILTSNDFLLCLSSVISCLDEKFFFQSFLARHQLCAAHILAWKFTLHFVPLLIIFILCRYHLLLCRKFQSKVSNVSTLNQLLCSNLSILIPFVLAFAWSVDGLWLWGVANIRDFLIRTAPASTRHSVPNSINKSSTNETFPSINQTVFKLKDEDDEDAHLYLPQQKSICYLQTNHNYQFTVRLLHLIQADFLLLFSLHLIGLFLEIALQIRVCCCILLKKATSALAHERQLCLYVLYLFTTLTLTSLPFYFYRTIEIFFDLQSNSASTDFSNSQMFAQLLLFGVSFKPILFFMLFHPSSISCISNLYPRHSTPIIDEEEQRVSTPDCRSSVQQAMSPRTQSVNHSPRDRTSSFPHVTLNTKSVQFDTWI